jgi:drug/metabolite transporter (DMT)-like permease
MQKDRRETLVAIALFVAVLFGSAMVFSIVPYLSIPEYGFGYHAFQIMLCFTAVALILMLPWAFKQGKKRLQTKQWKLFMLRATLEFVAFSLSFYSLQYLDLPKHTALNFLTPLLSTLVVILVLKEKGYTHTWVALVLGFVGMLIVTRPGVIPFNIGVMYVLGAAFTFSFCSTVIKLLTLKESPEKIAFYMLSLTTLIALPFGIYHWKTPSLEGWFWLCVIGVIAYAQQIMVAKAISKVPLLTLTPLNFLQLVFSSLLSYAVYAKLIDRWTFIGALVILAATLYNAWQTTEQAAKIRKENKGR